MFNIIPLNNRNMYQFLKLNNLRKHFNNLNEDFCQYYNNMNILKQFLLRKSIKILCYSNEIIGYIWTTSYDKNTNVIKSMYVKDNDDFSQKYNFMLRSLMSKKNLIYSCEKNSYNFDVLEKLGFKKLQGTFEMCAKVEGYKYEVLDTDLIFQVLKKGEDEEIRCKIQNEVFKNETRLPLTVEDMYLDETQHYYFNKGAIFIKKDNQYIGYGQIIINGQIPTIVNLGILKEFRGKGYGKALMNYLFKLLNDYGFKEVNLKVSADNYIALNLYKSLGFILEKEIYKWEYGVK
ncbi:GNAT family N-acetyltransferase [Clostridium sp. SYSU_GA19001]|uniref:GNAT family N-acetyltransferase n=1 Tax=Clostridium caldaquaticum TaxID=2940653 RepID=UPI0020771AAF|nr:GNAT family N-acetyltransferase [Clostridium caldaquaticum]MCM8710660.1 GNAT family N-acetyltransferase [Clostridium caldaquaticum]